MKDNYTRCKHPNPDKLHNGHEAAHESNNGKTCHLDSIGVDSHRFCRLLVVISCKDPIAEISFVILRGYAFLLMFLLGWVFFAGLFHDDSLFCYLHLKLPEFPELTSKTSGVSQTPEVYLVELKP